MIRPTSYLSTRRQSPLTCCGSTVKKPTRRALGQRCPDGTLGDGDVYRWAASNRHRGSDADQRSHEWRGLPGLHRAMFGPNASKAQVTLWWLTTVPFSPRPLVVEECDPRLSGAKTSATLLRRIPDLLTFYSCGFDPLKTCAAHKSADDRTPLNRAIDRCCWFVTFGGADLRECIAYFRHSGY